MKRFYSICLGFIMISNICFSQFKLDIEIVNIRNNTGNIMLELFDRYEKVVTREKGSIKDNKCSFSFTNLNPGKYDVRYYHDENLNSKMEKNLVGKPTEGYGFFRLLNLKLKSGVQIMKRKILICTSETRQNKLFPVFSSNFKILPRIR